MGQRASRPLPRPALATCRLGHHTLSIVSFRIRHGAQYLHHNFVVAVLNDLFGVQARGGCSCAGPYVHRLLAIGAARSHALREEIGLRCEGIKPGWSRVNLNYFISAAQADYIAAAVELIAADGHRLLPSYRFDPHTGLWRHATGPPRPPLTLAEVNYGPNGEMAYRRCRGRGGEHVYPGYLRNALASALWAARPAARRANRPQPRLRGASLVPATARLPSPGPRRAGRGTRGLPLRRQGFEDRSCLTIWTCDSLASSSGLSVCK